MVNYALIGTKGECDRGLIICVLVEDNFFGPQVVHLKIKLGRIFRGCQLVAFSDTAHSGM